MNQKIVTFEVAKALKRAGYHAVCNHFYADGFDDEDNPKHEFVICAASIPTFVQDWNDLTRHPSYDENHKDFWKNVWSAPSYVDAWFWLWRQEKFKINLVGCVCMIYDTTRPNREIWSFEYSDPEQAIITAVNYLANNDLIK